MPERQLATIAARSRERCEELLTAAMRASWCTGYSGVRSLKLHCGTVFIAYVQIEESMMTLQAYLNLASTRATQQCVFNEGADLTGILEKSDG